jgi:hypothetical protein
MPAWNSIESVVTGIVRSVNEKGLKLEGQENWFNVSKFAVGVVLPERGQAVACTLDKAGFLRAVEGVGELPAPVRGGSDVLAAAAAPSQKDRTITRLACLKAAAEFAAPRDLKSGHVLSIAASWEKWVNRPDDEQTTYELTDAF